MDQLNKKEFWEESWVKHMHSYLNAPPRTGHFIEAYFGVSINSILEIGGGSCRDSRYLAEKGYKVTASDFDEKTITYLKSKFENPIVKYIVADAFNLCFEKKTFDLVFHNGLFIYFQDDLDLYKMIREQAKVSSKYILIIVHNKTNTVLVKKFKRLSKEDKLYDIRYFEPEEIKNIVMNSGIKYKKIELLKFGGMVDIIYRKILRRFMPAALKSYVDKIMPKIFQFESWRTVERVVCLVEL